MSFRSEMENSHRPAPDQAVLTPREKEVLLLYGVCGSAKVVAAKLGLKVRTVQHHLEAAREKFGVGSSIEAYAIITQGSSGTLSTDHVQIRGARHVPWPFWTSLIIVTVLAVSVFRTSSEPRPLTRTMPRVVGMRWEEARSFFSSLGISIRFLPVAKTSKTKRSARTGSIVAQFPPQDVALPDYPCAIAYVASERSECTPSTNGFFSEEFVSPNLAPEWEVANGQGRISLKDHSGWLRYLLGGSTDPVGDAPALKVWRPMFGISWTLELRSKFFLPAGTGRQLAWKLLFGSGDRGPELELVRNSDQQGRALVITLNDGDQGPTNNQVVPADDTWVIRVFRRGQSVSIQISTDGKEFRPVSSLTYHHDLGQWQRLVLSGSSFGQEGGYVDTDYVRFCAQRE